MSTIKAIWDFHGPEAMQTATHFEKHLRERFEAEEWEAEAFGTGSAGPGHAAAWCVVSAELVPAVRAALHPQRGLPGDHEGV